jgi:hypothetical protein
MEHEDLRLAATEYGYRVDERAAAESLAKKADTLFEKRMAGRLLARATLRAIKAERRYLAVRERLETQAAAREVSAWPDEQLKAWLGERGK